MSAPTPAGLSALSALSVGAGSLTFVALSMAELSAVERAVTPADVGPTRHVRGSSSCRHRPRTARRRES